MAIKECLAKTAFYLKHEFNMVAPKLLEILVVDANADIDIKSEDANMPSMKSEGPYKSVDIKVRGMENAKRVTLNTSALENKVNAFKHIMMLS